MGILGDEGLHDLARRGPDQQRPQADRRQPEREDRLRRLRDARVAVQGLHSVGVVRLLLRLRALPLHPEQAAFEVGLPPSSSARGSLMSAATWARGGAGRNCAPSCHAPARHNAAWASSNPSSVTCRWQYSAAAPGATSGSTRNETSRRGPTQAPSAFRRPRPQHPHAAPRRGGRGRQRPSDRRGRPARPSGASDRCSCAEVSPTAPVDNESRGPPLVCGGPRLFANSGPAFRQDPVVGSWRNANWQVNSPVSEPLRLVCTRTAPSLHTPPRPQLSWTSRRGPGGLGFTPAAPAGTGSDGPATPGPPGTQRRGPHRSIAARGGRFACGRGSSRPSVGGLWGRRCAAGLWRPAGGSASAGSRRGRC